MLARGFRLWLALGVVLLLAAPLRAQSQQPAPPAPPAPAQEPAPPVPSQHSAHPPKHSHANDFLIKGTVFTPDGLAFPGVEVRVRRVAEKKFRWADISNFRGEFALRVPQGAQYELVAHRKNFQEQSRQIDAASDEQQVNLALQMKSVEGGKGK